MREPEAMSVAELEALVGRVEHLLVERRLEERISRELPGRARWPHPAGERRWLEPLKKKCGNAGCRKGCNEGRPAHGPYWYLYYPADTGSGLTSKHLGRELRSDVAAEFGLPAQLDAAVAHGFSRQARREEILREETAPTGSAAASTG